MGFQAMGTLVNKLAQVVSTDQSCLFPPGYRAAGVLLHVSSLPSRYGVGDFGPQAVQWIDALADAQMTWWQILPIGPTGAGNSPYTPLSTFACNPLLISPDWLLEDRLLDHDDFQTPDFDQQRVDYGAVLPYKRRLLDLAWQRFQAGNFDQLTAALDRFSKAEARWLDDFALFVVLKERFGGAAYVDWPTQYVQREVAALDHVRLEMNEAIRRVKWEQMLCFRQLSRLRQHAARRGVSLFGDIPIFVSADSADVWAHPELFQLDENRRPRLVAGVPPDYFSATGQLWGNPVYDWQELKRTGYRWWIDRLRSLLKHHDVIRLDHFRGFAAAWHIPAEAPTAETGQWVDGPGAEFFTELHQQLGCLPFVAEDLGTITDDVRQLLDDFRFPRMSVLQFAFDQDEQNAFLPHNIQENVVAYTGTHDNDTSRGWYATQSPENQAYLWRYLNREPLDESQVAQVMVETAWNSRAAVAIAPLQDLLNLGSEARMNLPGVADGNWGWRCTPEQMSEIRWDEFRQLTSATGRGPG